MTSKTSKAIDIDNIDFAGLERESKTLNLQTSKVFDSVCAMLNSVDRPLTQAIMAKYSGFSGAAISKCVHGDKYASCFEVVSTQNGNLVSLKPSNPADVLNPAQKIKGGHA